MKDIKLENEEKLIAQKNYDDIVEKLNKQKYTSLFEERKRISKLFSSMKIKKPIEEVYNAFLQISLDDMNPNLKNLVLEEGSWYRSSKKNNNNIFKLEKLVENKEISITWAIKNQLFIKSVKFRSNSSNKITKITYFDFAKGDTSIMGFFERHILSVYLKKQFLAFRVQVYKTKLLLNLYKPAKVVIVNKKIDKLLEYIKNII
ncbi:hypothetical protein SCORR_v1c02930 [Spiroplasma corruscae]|uniref:Uncharacterized protein n=1 Tax=Spiroplasma corruscae TaxID=216934 RepID=A0A222ENK7_9MOLU|nr:hypothetical protein [Spiroplasma corruscae]ASP28067.1 hypothetical protein SCORR_v1c02930 [Spiroplasma corruscae]